MRRITAPFLPLALVLSLSAVYAFGQSGDANTIHQLRMKPSPKVTHGLSIETRKAMVAAGAAAGANNQLPVWNYELFSSRDGIRYQGEIVGRNPNTRGADASLSVPVQLVPIILKFHSVATALSSKGIFTTAPGDTTSDPTVADTGCFTGAANVPINVMAQSPILNNADFNIGGTDVGTTQYVDAFQRANFWSLIDKKNYHVRLGPVHVLSPLTIDVPAAQGLSIPASFFGPALPLCGAESLISFSFFDQSVINALSTLPGVNPGTLPLLMIYNTGMSLGDPTNLGDCCAGGFHSTVPVGPVTFQTYAPFDFDVSGLFLPAFNDTATPSHEVAEWMNDPFDINDTPAWGHVGQVGGCQGNMEVGDPLSGTLVQRIAMPNGYTYQLQELAFFSWFFGAPSLGIHGWFSDNATFLTDAGAPCQ